VNRSFPNTYSILLRVQGAQETSNPYLLCAHLDVVPAGDRGRWLEEPFLGEVVEQDGGRFIFGRGAIDDKHSVVGILLALEAVLRDGGQPQRTLYVALGHDEEVVATL
jgi:carboxypeptidase PM20D1